jgi:hypothetical protein
VIVVDAHQHFWTADHPWPAADGLDRLRRDYTVRAGGDLMTAILGGRSAGIFGRNAARVYRWEL